MSDGLTLVDPVKDARHVAACLAQGGFDVRPASMPSARPESGAKVRKVKPLTIAGPAPAAIVGGRPRFVMADPKTLLVDETYQRNLSEKSLRLIRKIVAGWSWRKFTPPVAAETKAGLELLDGQHTAIAAASRPDLGLIPVMVVDALALEDRARAFVARNTDRLGMTAMQLHFAAVAGLDETAVHVDQVAREAGVTILRVSPAKGAFKPRETVAVAAIGALIAKRGGGGGDGRPEDPGRRRAGADQRRHDQGGRPAADRRRVPRPSLAGRPDPGAGGDQGHLVRRGRGLRRHAPPGGVEGAGLGAVPEGQGAPARGWP